MPSLLSKVFRGRDANGTSGHSRKAPLDPQRNVEEQPRKPRWDDAWTRESVAPSEVHELLHGCTKELKARGVSTPFLLLPYRPASDPSAARTFIRNFFNAEFDRGEPLKGAKLQQELRLTEHMVLCSVIKWCWSRLPGGVVTWEVYELFKIGEQDSNFARDAFTTFVPLAVEDVARLDIVTQFFELLAALAANGKKNGLGGRKLSRYAGWWAFDHTDQGAGFDGGYRSWVKAADATCHLFFAYLRSLAPDPVRGAGGITALPISLTGLVQATEYPPEFPTLMQTLTTRMVMVVSTVSDTPFALLRRARNFEYRDDDAALQAFSQFEDPMKALTEECLRVLKCISSTNQSVISSSKNSTSLRDASWSRFEDIGFSGALDDSDNDESEITRFQRTRNASNLNSGKGQGFNRMQSSANSISYDMDRPTTPSWADFMSAGFSNEAQQQSHSPLFLTPDQVLPPVQTSRRAASVTASLGGESELDPGELANITQFDLDDAFWWTWISSLAGEETMKRKAVFGRCALVETTIKKAKWIVIEEQVRGAEVLPESNAHTVERKRGFRSFSQRARNTFRKTNSKKEIVTPLQKSESIPELGRSRPKITIEQQNKIQTAAAALQQRKRLQENPQLNTRGRSAVEAEKSMALTTLPPVVLTEAMPAMKWANKFDKDAIREAYLANNSAGRGLGNPLPHSQSTPTLSKLDLHKDVSNAATSPTSDVTAVVDQGGDHLKGTRATKSETVPTLATELPRSSDSGISTSRPRLDLDEEPKPAALPSREASREPIDRTIDQSIGSSDSLAGPSSINTSGTVKQSSVPDPNLQPTPKPIEPSTAPGAKAKEPQNGGLRKMFGRKRPVIGSSKLPPSVEGRGRETENSDVETTSTLKPPSAVPARRRSVLRRKNGQTEPTSSSSTLPFDAAEPERSHKSVSDNVGTPQRPGGTQVEASSRPQAESRVKPPAPSAKPRDMPATYNPTVVDRTPKSTPYTPTPERSMGPRPGVSSQVDALFGPSQSGTSPTSTMEERSAVNEFSSFDQGPLPDIPAFVPDIGQDSSDNAITPYRRRSPVRHKKTEATPVPKPEVAQKVVPVKEEQAAVPDAKVSSQQERWARIKANAAERAARADEEKPGALPAKKGVESVEEETIESRVARIKARVAELTGNPNGPLSTA